MACAPSSGTASRAIRRVVILVLLLIRLSRAASGAVTRECGPQRVAVGPTTRWGARTGVGQCWYAVSSRARWSALRMMRRRRRIACLSAPPPTILLPVTLGSTRILRSWSFLIQRLSFLVSLSSTKLSSPNKRRRFGVFSFSKYLCSLIERLAKGLANFFCLSCDVHKTIYFYGWGVNSCWGDCASRPLDDMTLD